MKKWLILFLSLVLAITLVTPQSYSATISQGGALFSMLPIYLKRNSSGIGSYKTLSIIKPTATTSYADTVNPSTTGEYYVDGWITNAYAFPSGKLTLDKKYNFLFSVWANGQGNATLFWRFYIYRNSQEIELLTSQPSCRINRTTAEHLWQTKTKQTITFLSGDRLLFKLYLSVTVLGVVNVLFDGKNQPSYLTDPTETRYFRNSITLPGRYDLWTSNTASDTGAGAGNWVTSGTYRLGIRVWKNSTGGSETEITSGSSVAVVSFVVGVTGYLSASATWSCPETSLATNDSIVVRVYEDINVNPPASLIRTFQTESLYNGNAVLNASTWTVYYWVYRVRALNENPPPTYIYSWGFVHGGATHNSRITNFIWTEIAGGAPQIVIIVLTQITEVVMEFDSRKKIYNTFLDNPETIQVFEATIRHRLFVELSQVVETIQEFATKRIIRPVWNQITEVIQTFIVPIVAPEIEIAWSYAAIILALVMVPLILIFLVRKKC